MLLATIRENDKTETFLFNSWGNYHSATFSPEVETLSIIPLSVRGKNYAERKANAEQIAIDFSLCALYNISWNEICVISAFFEKIGKRYGLLSAFRENGIC